MKPSTRLYLGLVLLAMPLTTVAGNDQVIISAPVLVARPTDVRRRECRRRCELEGSFQVGAFASGQPSVPSYALLSLRMSINEGSGDRPPTWDELRRFFPPADSRWLLKGDGLPLTVELLENGRLVVHIHQPDNVQIVEDAE